MSRVELGGTAALTAGTERAPKPCRWCRSFHPGGPLEAPVVLPTAPAGFSSWQNPNGKTLFLPPLSKRFCKRCPGGGRVPAPPTHRPLTDVAPPLSHSRSLSATADPPRQAPATHRPFPAPSARGFQHNGWETAPGTAPGPPPSRTREVRPQRSHFAEGEKRRITAKITERNGTAAPTAGEGTPPSRGIAPPAPPAPNCGRWDAARRGREDNGHHLGRRRERSEGAEKRRTAESGAQRGTQRRDRRRSPAGERTRPRNPPRCR